jgi:hypothetical protein
MPGIWDPTGSLGPLGAGGGRPLGVASGEIRIDTSQAERARVEIRRVGQDMATAFKPASNAIRAFGRDIQTMRGELLALSVASAGLVASGIKAVQTIRGAEIQFRALLGSEQMASRTMGQLDDLANKFGLRLRDVYSTANALLPVLKGNTDELDEWVSRAARLATRSPFAGTEKAADDATRAIAEFMAGQEISLQRLFNIAPDIIHQAVAQAEGDRGTALDLILERVGATEEAAKEMADTWQGAMARLENATVKALDQAFRPMLDDFITPGIEKVADFVATLQEANPALLQIGVGAAGVIAVGAPLLLFLGAVITSLQTIRTLSIAPALGRVAGVGLATAGGFLLGAAGTRAIGRATGNEDLANLSNQEALGRILEFFKQLAVIVAVLVDKALAPAIVAFTELVGIMRIFGATMQNALGQFLASIGQTVVSLGEMISQLSPQQGASLVETGDALRTWGQNLQISEDQMRALADEIARSRDATAQWVAEMNLSRSVAQALYPAPMDSWAESWQRGGAGRGVVTGWEREQEWAPTSTLTEDIKDAWLQFQTDLADIEAQAAEQRLDEEESYQERRTELIEQYGDRAADVVEAREKKLADIREQMAEDEAEARQREADAVADHAEKMADLEAEAQAAEVRRLEDFQREERRARQQHWLTLLQAASRLDARAIAEENERYALQQGNRSEDFDVETQRRAEQLAERLAQEQENHEERLLEARRADERRLQDLQEALDEERLLAAQRLEELAQERQEELNQLYEQHVERLIEIDQQERELSDQRQNAFIMQLNQLDAHYGTLLGLQIQGQAEIEAEFAAWLDGMRAQISAARAIDTSESYQRSRTGPGGMGYYQHGGAVDYTGLAMVHGSPSRPEWMIDADTAARLGRYGWNYTQEGLLAMAGGASGGGERSISWGGDVVINFPDKGNLTEDDVYRTTHRALVDAFKEIAGE